MQAAPEPSDIEWENLHVKKAYRRRMRLFNVVAVRLVTPNPSPNTNPNPNTNPDTNPDTNPNTNPDTSPNTNPDTNPNTNP